MANADTTHLAIAGRGRNEFFHVSPDNPLPIVIVGGPSSGCGECPAAASVAALQAEVAELRALVAEASTRRAQMKPARQKSVEATSA